MRTIIFILFVWFNFLDVNYDPICHDWTLSFCDMGPTCPVKAGTEFSALVTGDYVPDNNAVAFLRVLIQGTNSDPYVDIACGISNKLY